jgi:hypothetical protein
VELKLTRMHGGKPWMTEFDNKIRARCGQGDRTGFGQAPVFNREGGSIPVARTFQEELGVPSVLFGVGLPDETRTRPTRSWISGTSTTASSRRRFSTTRSPTFNRKGRLAPALFQSSLD